MTARKEERDREGGGDRDPEKGTGKREILSEIRERGNKTDKREREG